MLSKGRTRDSEGSEMCAGHLRLPKANLPEARVLVYCFVRKEEGFGSSSFNRVGFELGQCEPGTA